MSAAALLCGAGCSLPELRYRAAAPVAQFERLRDAFNRGACDSIYSEASQPFRLLESSDNWMSECGLMRAHLGDWRSFDTSRVEIGSPFDLHVFGTAVFERGRGRLETTWILDDAALRLFKLDLDTAERRTFVPAPAFKPRRQIDPPLRPTYRGFLRAAFSDTPRIPS